jgi:hypothetical protein
MVRRNRHWLWIRSAENNVTAITAPAFGQSDLLSSYRTLAGVTLTIPDFTIWRIRISISIKFSLAAASDVDSNAGVLVAILVDDMSDPGTNPVVSQYHERYLLWDQLYVYKTFAQGGNLTSIATAEHVALYKEYDLKGHRKLSNIGDSLLLQVAPVATGSIANYSFQQSTLVLLRN